MIPMGMARRARWLSLGIALMATTVGADTTYRWIDPVTGGTVISDMPPPAGAKQVTKYTGPQIADEPTLPYAVRQASERFPVVLYTNPGCTACKQARTLLDGRGVPYTETVVKTDEELNELTQRLGGESILPSVSVGRQSARGFSAVVWNALLDAAGYPTSPPYRPRPPAAVTP